MASEKSVADQKAPAARHKARLTGPVQEQAVDKMAGRPELLPLLQNADVSLLERQKIAQGLVTVLGNQGLQRAIEPQHAVQRAGELAGTSPIPSYAQGEIEHILNPNRTASGETEEFVEENFDNDMLAALNNYIPDAAQRSREQLAPTSPRLDIAHIRTDIADEAQGAVRQKYGGYVRSASMPASDRLRQSQYRVRQNVLPYTAQPVTSALLRDLVEYFMTIEDIGGPVITAHHVDRSRAPDQSAFRRVRDQCLNAHRTDLTDIQKAWPGEMNPATLKIYIQTRLEPEEDRSNAEVERSGNWSAFQTLIHEYIHVLEHPRFYADMSSKQSPTGYQILTEGLCDHFAEQVWNDVTPTLEGDAGRRSRIEGQALPYDENVIPEWNSYDEIGPAREIVALTGEENARAAFFMGHVEFLGGRGYSTQDWMRDEMYTVPSGGKTVAEIAAITNIPVSELTSADNVSADHRYPEGEQVFCSGIHYHVIIPSDIGLRIAEQYGVPFALLNRANPGTNWQALRTGRRLLIPRP